MRLTRELYPELETYLFYDKKLRDGVKNEIILKSRYSVLCAYFSEHDFNRVNFTKFVRYMREKGYSGSYINVLITMAKHIDKFYNINELQDFTRFPKEDKPVYILTPEEIERMAEVDVPYARDREEINQKYQALIYVLFYTGARISEILNLRWDDLQPDPVPHLIMNQTKVYELRYSPIPQDLYEKLVRLPHYSGYIFSSKEGKQVDRTTVGDDLKRRAKLVGIDKRVYNHLFRHSFANFMRRNGAPIESISKMLGHKSVDTTNRSYMHIMLEELSDVLHYHHPQLKKQQTIDTIPDILKEVIHKIIDAERFDVNLFRHKKKVRIEISELED
jgi:integrase/recombinase XerD